MSNYGSRTNADGEAHRGDGRMPVMTGERVVGCTLQEVAMATDDNGQVIPNRAVVRFQQPNGSTFQQMYFESDQDWAIDRTNQQFLHLATKLVTEEEYYAAIGTATSFSDFIAKVSGSLMPASQGKSFTLKIALRESNGNYFPTFPNYPNFIELDGTTPSTLSTNAKYDFYEAPSATSAADALEETADEEPAF